MSRLSDAPVRRFAAQRYSTHVLSCLMLCWATSVSAQTAPPLGSAQSFAVLGASTVTNTGSTVITGDLGVSPGTAVTGFPPGAVVSGAIHSADALAASAQSAAVTAYTNLAGQTCDTNLTGTNLGGLTLTPGVYCFASSAQLTGILTLDAQGDPNAVFVFQMGSTITTASNASVVMINGGAPCNVFWQVGSSATLGTNTAFAGNVIALASITVTTGTSVTGRTFALNGAVTMDTNAINATCAPAPPVCPTITLSPATLPNGTVGLAYSQTITGSGGAAPYTFAVTSGTLPAGLTLSSAGVLAGTPTTAGPSTFTIQATDANGCVASISYTITVTATPPPVCPTIALSPATLTNGTIGVVYSQTLAAGGGVGPYVFALLSGSLPTGLTLSPAGVLAGTPTTAGPSAFTIQATDANGCVASISYTITVTATPPPVCPTITFTPATLPNGTVGVAVNETIVGSGGVAPYTFLVASGALPAGLTLSPAGVLAGTPTSAGASTFTIQGTDANGCVASVVYTITIAAAPTPPAVCPTISLSHATLPAGALGVGYRETIGASGGAAPYNFGVTSGVLPPGVTLSATGQLAGIPTATGLSNVTIRATDANGCFREVAYAITVIPAVPISSVAILVLALGLAAAGYLSLRWRRSS